MSKPLQHSPGPWKPARGHGGGEAYVVDAENWEICVPRTQADVRLIAAAPDMLRLLRVLVDKQDGGLDEYWELQNMATVSEARELITRLDGGE